MDIATWTSTTIPLGYVGRGAVVPLDESIFLAPTVDQSPLYAYNTETGTARRLEGLEGSMAATGLTNLQPVVFASVTDEFWDSVADASLKC